VKLDLEMISTKERSRKGMKIGFIGLGHMGSHMVNNILKKKCGEDTVYVWNRSQYRIDAAVENGAVAASGVADIAEKCDLVFLCLPGPHEVRKIVGEAGGLIDNGHKGQFIVDISTVDREISIEMAELAEKKGIMYIDMPVSGGVYRAEAGDLSLMLAATEEEAKAIIPYIMMMGDKVTYLNKRGNGSAAKLIHNAVSLSTQIVDAEAMIMADYLGIPAEAIIDVIQKGAAHNDILTYHGPRILARDEEGGHDVVLAVKDLELCAEMARKMGTPNFTLNHAIQWYKYAVIKGKGHKDSSSVVNVMRDEFAPNDNIEVYDL